MPAFGDLGFNTDGGSTAPAGCSCELVSTDGSVELTETATGYDITVEHNICELMSAVVDNGLVIGG